VLTILAILTLGFLLAFVVFRGLLNVRTAPSAEPLLRPKPAIRETGRSQLEGHQDAI
jgi:hypothetical protein